MASTIHPPDPFLPVQGEQPRVDFANWKKEFRLFLSAKEIATNRQIANKRLSLREPLTEAQTAAFNQLVITETDKLHDLFLGLGSEAFRKFGLKTGWDFENLEDPQNPHTLLEALGICDGMFSEQQHPVLLRTLLYRRQRKHKETYEDFVSDLRKIARDCQLGDQEDTRIMEALLTNCNDKELLEKVLDAHPGIPTLAQVLTIANRHEATKKDLKIVKFEPSSAFAIRNDGESVSEIDGDSDSSSSDGEVLFVAKKKGTGKNRNYIL